tara:strand:+ start:107 stop:4852 length:4746 start_codon:yes stop_codon:yes gene_type:complete
MVFLTGRTLVGVMPEEKIVLNKQQDVFFCSLKKLWLSLLPEHERRERFPDALEQIPSKLVTTSSFCDYFNTSGLGRGELDGERAWFGIRSILKGGTLAVDTDHTNSYEKHHLAQLGQVKGINQIPARHTRKYFSDSELISLLDIYEGYQKYLKSNGLYDDIDIVLRALKHHDGDSAGNQKERDKKFERALVLQERKKFSGLRLNNDRVIFRKSAEKEIKKNVKNDNLKLLSAWIKRNILQHKVFRKKELSEINGNLVAKTTTGIPIYKSPLSGGGRVFWTPRNNENRNEIQIVIYDFCLTKENGDPRLEKIIKNYKLEPRVDFVSKIEATDFEIDDLPGQGPSKPWPDADDITHEQLENVVDEANILLDEIQEKAILSNQPLLIDGLAGTGKTSVLSYRGVTRCVASPAGTKIMVLASKDHVVQKISETMDKIAKRGMWGDVKFKMNYILAPGISHAQQETLGLQSFVQQMPEDGFDEIILDECQDITSVEFEMLMRLLIGHNLRRLVFAGDPLQTLNPTGFDWNRLKAMFIDRNVEQKHVKMQQFHNNYRSQKYIVDFANGVQIKRGKTLADKHQTIMSSKKDATDRIRLIKFNLENAGHMSAIEGILGNSGESRAIVITPAPDDTGIQHLFGDSTLSDPILRRVWKKVQEQHKDLDMASFRDALYLHSASSVKGAEYNVVVLYRFAGTQERRTNLHSLLEPLSEVTPATKENQIAVSYEYSKLYVALTRAFDRVYMIEDEDGIQFWKNIQLSDLNGYEIDVSKYLDFESHIEPTKACQSEDLKPEIEANKDNYENERNMFRKDPTAIVALVNAIGLGKRLLAKDPSEELRLELLDLEGERAWIKSRHHAIDDNQRLKLQKEALQKFTEAQKYDKVAPIHYSSKDFKRCLDVLQGYANNNFYSFIKSVCKIKLMSPKDKQKSDGLQNLDELMFCLDPSIIPKGPWSRITPMDDGRETVENYILKSHKLTQILDHIKGTQHFTVWRLYNSFQELDDRIMLLENKNLTRNPQWYDKYHDHVCQFIRLQDTTDKKNEVFYAKKDKIRTSTGDPSRKKEWDDLRLEIDEMMLVELPPHKQPRLKLSILFEEDGIEKDPATISNHQKRGILLARRIHNGGGKDMGFFSEIFDAGGAQVDELLFRHTQIVEKLLPSLLFTVENNKFLNYKNLGWFNAKSYKRMLDSHINDLWQKSITEEFQHKEPREIWKDYIAGPREIRGSSGVGENEKRRREFESWFRNFYRYAYATTFKANMEQILGKLFSWLTWEGVDLSISGQSCIETIIVTKPVKSTLYDYERIFIEKYMTARDVQIKPNYWKELRKFKHEGLVRTLNKAKWVRQNISFMNEYDDSNATKLDQKKLERYITILKENGFREECLEAENKRIVSESDAAGILQALWSKNQVVKYLEKRNDFFLKGVKLPIIEEFDESELDILEWLLQYGFGFMKEEPPTARTELEGYIFGFLFGKSFPHWLVNLYFAQSGQQSPKDELTENPLYEQILVGMIMTLLPEIKIGKRSIYENFLSKNPTAEANIRMLMAFAEMNGLCKFDKDGLTLKPEINFLSEHEPFKEGTVAGKVAKLREMN